MAITIGGQIPTKDVPRNVYRFFVETMIGDADGQSYLHFDAKTTESVQEFMAMLKDMEAYGEFTPEACEFASMVGWPYDPMYGDDYQALHGYAVTFFDENGVEWEVWDGKKNLSEMKKYHIPR